MSKKFKVAALQKRMGSHVRPAEIDKLRALGVDLLCLPEYFFIPGPVRNQVQTVQYRQSILNKLEDMSKRLLGVVVGGTLIERDGTGIYNTCHIFESGRHVGFYRKMHPTDRERDKGISPGDAYKVFEVRGIRLGILICADALYRISFDTLAEQKPDLIAAPTTSPFRPDDTVVTKEERDRKIYLAGAGITGAHIVKACGVGLLMGERLQGRSLICNAETIIQRVSPKDEALEATLIAEIEL